MKRLFLPFLLAFFGFSGMLMAQPTLTAANTNVQIGEYFPIQAFNANIAHFNSGVATGANITWNFSSLTSAFNTFIAIQPNPGVILGSFSFPTATAALAGFQVYDYIQANNDSVNVVGYFNNNTEETIEYSNSVKKLQYPFTYNSFFMDSFAGVGDGLGPPVNFGGYITVAGDGYGTLRLPAGTVSNVLRVKSIKVTITNSGIDTTTTLDWYLPGVHVPVLQISKTKYESFNYNATTYRGYFLDPFALSVKEELASPLNLQTFPNPATSEVIIQASLKKPSKVHLVLTDALGKEVLKNNAGTQADGHFTQKLDVSNLPKGIYLLRLEAAENVAVKKLLVQ